MWSKLLRLAAGVLLLPLCVAVTWGLVDLLRHLPRSGRILSPETYCLLGGYFLWLVTYFAVMRPMHAYVWAHELTHALWGLLFFAKIHSIRAKPSGGAVALSKTNLLIALSPYFFPFYTMLVILCRAILSLWFPMEPFQLIWLFLIGFTWGFHFTFTIQSLAIRQPDVVEYGRVFSLALIYLLNLAGIGIWVVCTTDATFAGLGGFLLDRAAQVYGQIGEWLLLLGGVLGNAWQRLVTP